MFFNQGALDVIAIYYDDKNKEIKTKIFINKFYSDALFFKITVLNSLCFGSCGSSVQSFGVNYAGATIKHTFYDARGNLRITQTSQLPQQAYQSLQVAGQLIGLGRTSNYIEEVFVGISKRSSNNLYVKSYRGLVPNSILYLASG